MAPNNFIEVQYPWVIKLLVAAIAEVVTLVLVQPFRCQLVAVDEQLRKKYFSWIWNKLILCQLLLLQPAAAHLALDASLVESFSVRRVHLGRVVQHVDKYVSGVLKNFIQVSAMYMHSVHLSIEL